MLSSKFVRRGLGHILSCFLIGVMLAFGPAAQAQDHIVARAWLEDPTGQLRWPDVQQQPMQAFTGALNRGYGASPIWLRLKIDPASQPKPRREPEQLVLRIRPVYLDDIQIYDPLEPRGQAGLTGDLHHPRQDKFASLDFVVPILRGDQPRELWLRLASTSTRQIQVEALSVDDLDRTTHRQALVFAGYIGLVLVFVVWGLVYWLFSRERVIGAFGLAQTAALLYALSSLGYLRLMWPAQWPASLLDQASTLFSITAVSTAILFHVTLISEFRPPVWVHRLHMTLLGLFPLKVALLMLGLPILALQLNLSEVLWSPVIFLLSVWRSRCWTSPPDQRPALSRPVVMSFYALLVVLMLMAALPGLGLAAGGEIALYLVQTHGLLTAFLMLLMLEYRAHLMHQRQRGVALALELSQLQVQQERKVHEEQGKLLAMLGHELKTPLATMHMRLDPDSRNGIQLRQAIRDMNGVIDRCLQTTQLNDGQLLAQPRSVDLVKLMHDAISACAQPSRVELSAPACLTLATDNQLLFIVINNLLENACKYAAPDTPIHVDLNRPEGAPCACIEVRNLPGPAGLPATDQVFDKYYRSPHAKRQAGTGLGLYLARNLVHTLGGNIRYQPDDSWVRFIVELPLSD